MSEMIDEMRMDMLYCYAGWVAPLLSRAGMSEAGIAAKMREIDFYVQNPELRDKEPDESDAAKCQQISVMTGTWRDLLAAVSECEEKAGRPPITTDLREAGARVVRHIAATKPRRPARVAISAEKKPRGKAKQKLSH